MMFAASYYWYPMLTGRMYDRRLAIFQSSLLVVGSALTFMALMALGFLELPAGTRPIRRDTRGCRWSRPSVRSSSGSASSCGSTT